MPGPLGTRKVGGGGGGEADKGLGYIEAKVNERVQPVVQALREMRPVFEENTKAIQELTKALKER